MDITTVGSEIAKNIFQLHAAALTHEFTSPVNSMLYKIGLFDCFYLGHSHHKCCE